MAEEKKAEKRIDDVCSVCGDSEPFHVHDQGKRIDNYFTVGRGQSDFQAAQAWKRRALDALRDPASAPTPSETRVDERLIFICHDCGHVMGDDLWDADDLRENGRPNCPRQPFHTDQEMEPQWVVPKARVESLSSQHHAMEEALERADELALAVLEAPHQSVGLSARERSYRAARTRALDSSDALSRGAGE